MKTNASEITEWLSYTNYRHALVYMVLCEG